MGSTLNFLLCPRILILEKLFTYDLGGIASWQVSWGTTKMLITLFFKQTNKFKLSNQKPITLLNISYKFMLKPTNKVTTDSYEVINANQTMFSPLQYFLVHIFLAHKALAWAKHNNQEVVFMKLNFAKTYNTMVSHLCFHQ